MDPSSPTRLISEFYIALWAQLDSLSDERRWVRAVGPQHGLERVDSTLKQLWAAPQPSALPVSVRQLETDRARALEFLDEWHKAGPQDRNKLRARLEELRGYFEQQGVAFGAAAAGA